MLLRNGTISADLTIREDTHIHGTVLGTIYVSPNVTLKLTGTCSGDLIVDEGATAAVAGTISGRIVNHGGVIRGVGSVLNLRRKRPQKPGKASQRNR